MIQYAIDFILVSGLVIGMTAMMGVFANGAGQFVFRGKKQSESVSRSLSIQSGWNKIKRD